MTSSSSFQPELPKEVILAPESQPRPRFSRETEVEFEIRNHTVLNTIASKYNTSVDIPDAPTVKSKSSFYQKLDVSQRIEIDHGSPFEIDVQPDMRFATQYLMFTTSKEYPSLEVKEFPYCSLPSLVAYKLALFVGHHLISDITCKATRSLASEHYCSDPAYQTILQILKDCPIPTDVLTLLEYIAPVNDSQRSNLSFIPTFGGFSFAHDFGYSVPVTVFLNIHHILASNRTNADPSIIMTKIYNSPLVTVANVVYTVGDLFGGPFQNDQQGEFHRNWFNTALEAFINPVVVRSLVQRPTFAKTPLTTEIVAQSHEINGYDYLLGNPILNELILSAFLTDVSRFFRESFPGLRTLGDLLSTCTGLTLMTHSIEEFVLPTWHHLPPVTLPADGKEVSLCLISDETYADYTHYRLPEEEFDGTLPFPTEPDTIEPALYLVVDKEYNENESRIIYDTFDRRKHLFPNVLWFQPYNKSSQSIELAIAIGYKIISNELDAVTIPLPNIDLDLTDNNSYYRQGSFPLSKIRPVIPTSSRANGVRIYERTRHTAFHQAVGTVIRDMSINCLPVLASTNVDTAITKQCGLTFEELYNNPIESSTFVAWKSTAAPPVPNDRFLLWSSYRWIDHDVYTSDVKIHMYCTLRALFGTCVTLSRTSHPSKMVPS